MKEISKAVEYINKERYGFYHKHGRCDYDMDLVRIYTEMTGERFFKWLNTGTVIRT